MAANRNRVHQTLRNLDGERSLRNLLGRELGYEHKGDRISGDSYPDELQGEPTLFATAGREGRFSVIHTHFKTPGKLSLMAERKVMEKLYTKYRLGESRGVSRELRRRAEADLTPRVVVSEAARS